MAHALHSAAHHASKFTDRQRTIAVIIVALAFIMDLLDNTIINIAIPSIQSNLGASFASIQWLSAGYALAFAVLLITGGRLGDVFGYKKLFLAGVVGFTAASLISGLAGNIEILIAARLFQGATAALMVPQVMSLVQVMYPPAKRGAILGLFGAMAGLAASLGPILGGFLINWNIAGLDWRPIFLINIPVGIFAFFAGIRFLPEGKSPHPLRLDIVGTLLIIVALSLLVFPLIQGRELDWPTWIFLMIAASIPFFVWFWLWQIRKMRVDGSPLVVPALFGISSFRTGAIINIIFEMIMLGFFFTFTLILQIGLGYSVIEAALTGIPTAVGISVAIGFLAQKLVPRLGRYTMTLGAIVMVIGFTLILGAFALFQNDTQPWSLIPGLLILGLGMGSVMGLMFSVTLKDVDPSDAGSASGTLSAIQQIGGAIGIAVVGVIFFGALSSNATMSFDDQVGGIRTSLAAANIPQQAADGIIMGVETCYVDRTQAKDMSDTPDSCKQLAGAGQEVALPTSITSAITTATKDAVGQNFIFAFSVTMIYAIVLVIVTFFLSFLLPKKIQFDNQGH